MSKYLLILFVLSSSILHAQNRGKIELKQNIHLHWEIAKFDKSQHTFSYCVKNNFKSLCKIDNQEWFGSDIGIKLPTNVLNKLIIEIDKVKIKLDTSKMYNPNFYGSLSSQQFNLKKNKGNYILYGYFSDGAGSYTAHWQIHNGKAGRILISNNEEDFLWQLE